MSHIDTKEGQRTSFGRQVAFQRFLDGLEEPVQFKGLFWKSIFDRVVALVLLVPGLPLIGLLVALVRLTSRGPGIYRQQRVGREGRVFTMYKLRSMRIDAEAGTGPVWAEAGKDSRVTPLGNALRRLHLDELPQLFNVLRGEMSLVGPRPERPEFVAVLAEQIPGYLTRISVLPGITGLAQINLPPDTDLDSVRRKLMLDREYIDTVGPVLDLRIIVCTLLRVVGIRGGRGVWLLGLQRTVSLPRTSASTNGNRIANTYSPQQIFPVPAEIERRKSSPHATVDSLPAHDVAVVSEV